ncbi:MAG TPA: helix-turn-helix domain-containing protein [Ktedonobacteraceae bacterium]|nr:helix-turn-helix domain-containing protein [Ktedonobacteraceae bacterium]
MEEKQLAAWTAVTQALKNAALQPQQRDDFISCALEQLLISLAAAGTALIWPRWNRKIPWKVYYAGIQRNAMQRWLSARLEPSTEVTIEVIQHDLVSGLPDMPAAMSIRLQPPPPSPHGLWIIWAKPPLMSAQQGLVSDWIERIHNTLEAVLEVEDREEQYFSASSPLYDRELISALAHGDTHALSALLSLTRVVTKADFTFWAKAYQDIIEIAGHLGAKNGGFGFALPRGRGVGGRVAAYGKPIERGDYLNSPYRDPSVSDIVDAEQIRSGMALPIRYNTTPGTSAQVAAVLYATRRNVAPYSLAERMLAQRLAHMVEPLPLEIRPSSFSLLAVEQLSDARAAWYDIVLHANRIEAVEAWASQLIKGTVIVTDKDGQPYVFAHSERLEQMKVARDSQPEAVQVLSLAAPGVDLPGQVYLWPSIPLPPPHWPDFCVDLTLACNLVISRMEQGQDHLSRQRGQWLHALLKGQSTQYVEQEGYRLGLPVERGQVWVLAWSAGSSQTNKVARRRVVAESVVLDTLKSPLIFFDDDTAIILLEGQTSQLPSKLRDTLLKHCGPCPLWIVHGARYQSPHDLKMTLTHTIALAQKARREEYGQYLLDIYTFGLDGLLENPRLAADLDAFARKLLSPLIGYDAANGSHLTETFVLVQILGSVQAAAGQLAIHVNTVRYRLRKAQDILGIEQASPKELTALALAAFCWQRFHT